METVSVVIPVYNGAQTIRRAIDSALAQSWKDREVIVVDDGSTDGTLTLLEGYGNRIRAIHQSHCGVAFARNAAIEQSKGDYVAFLDADDEWLPEKLEVQLGMLRSMPDVGVLGGGTEWKKGGAGRFQVPTSGEVSLESLLFVNPLCTSTVVVRTSILRESSLRFLQELQGSPGERACGTTSGSLRDTILLRTAYRCGTTLACWRATGRCMRDFSPICSATPQYRRWCADDGMTLNST